MAIGRISGPMLLRNLERQGLDLAIDGNLIYFDVTNRRVGINNWNPNVSLDVIGDTSITGNLFVGNLVTVGNVGVAAYTLPNYTPAGTNQMMVAEGGGSLNMFWAPAPPESAIRRRRYTTTVSVPGYGSAEVVLPLGVSSIVYGLTVSRACKVEVFSTPLKAEPNPYTFIATPDHLTDDGTVFFNDGSSFQSRQFSIFANFEEPPVPNVYCTISSIDPYNAGGPVTLSIFYYPAVTDSGMVSP